MRESHATASLQMTRSKRRREARSCASSGRLSSLTLQVLWHEEYDANWMNTSKKSTTGVGNPLRPYGRDYQMLRRNNKSHTKVAHYITILAGFVIPIGSVPSARAAEVSALSLPTGFTVPPESEARLVTMSSDQTVAAVLQSIDSAKRTIAVRWDSAGNRSVFTPMPVETAPDKGVSETTPMILGIVAAPGVTYVNVGVVFSGAYSGLSVEAQRWIDGAARRWNLTGCNAGNNEDQHANGSDNNGQVAMTFDRTGGGSFQVMNDDIDTAPYAFVVNRNGCQSRGRAVILNVRDDWASGYRGYLGSKIAPTNLNTIIQRIVAVRWRGSKLTELGDGVAYAITTHGLAVGATAVPGRFSSETTNFFGNPGRQYKSPVPHAVAWDVAGRRRNIEMSATRSVAYDAANDGTIVGMLQNADGKHYAFRRHGGLVQRLDDLPHPPGWRFEAAYSIGEDGTIVGTGTLNNIPKVFSWRP